ncbi:sensor histidine kinase [Leptolyngbya ohadii]|uniref:sensor histidine kinase n=1 Tax=Leptolyngbya ohadii TaxID=1962290 RepID=UPI000B59B145|nr:ATP-binding protein [Leptolyngbya ohadii]
MLVGTVSVNLRICGSSMLRVLLIDDNIDDRTLVIRQLRQAFNQVEVIQVIDQASLDRALAAAHFDIAVTDYQLLWSNGLTVLRQLKAVFPYCPVIMFTNSATQENAIEAMKTGLDDYVLKSPRHYIRLTAAVRLALERAEDRRRAAQLEVRLQSLLNRLSVGVFRATIEGELLEANTAFLHLVGVKDFAEARSLNIHDLFLQSQERSLLWEQLQQEGQLLGREVQLQQMNGETRWVSINKIITQEGSDLFVEGLIEDITLRKQLEAALRHKAEELSQANRLKDEFLTTLYHELRTPLNAILGWSQILQTRKVNDQTVLNRALEAIERNALTQKRIVEDMLDVSSVIQGKLRLHITPINLSTVIASAVEVICPAAQAKSIRINISLAPSVGKVLGDSNRLQQVLWNLLANAVKFTPMGGQIQVQLERVDCYAEVRVTDSGIGISPAFLPYVFDRFRQADGSTTRSYGGMGLGLAIVRHLVELHGGTVQAESPGEGQGATFAIRIPLETKPAEPREILSPLPNQSSLSEAAEIAKFQQISDLPFFIDDQSFSDHSSR